MTVPLRAWLILGAVVAALLGFSAFVAHERQVGRLQILLATADSAHHADSVFSAQALQLATAATQTAEQAGRRYRQQQAGDAAAAAATDAATAALRTARDSALALARDSAATAAQLRAEIVRLVQRSDSTEAAHTRERAQLQATIRSAGAALHADSVAIRAGIVATNAALARAVDAERQRDLLRSAMPSAGARWLERAAWAGATVYFATRK